MIPKIDIQVHNLFINAFFFSVTYGPKEKLDEDIKKFKDFFNENGEKILTLIEKFSGYSWTKDRIPVYLVPKNPNLNYSFAKSTLENDLPGVVQKIGMGYERDIHIHIHELAHINQWQSDFMKKNNPLSAKSNGEKNNDGIELGADIVALYVLRNIFGEDSEFEKDFMDFLNNTNDKNKIKFAELNKYKDKWNLNENSLRHYVEKGEYVEL